MQFLMDEGVSIENARRDASYWAIHNSDETMQILKKSCQKNEVKKLIKQKYKFKGSFLNKKINEGIYQFQFFIHDGTSMKLNECFEHPCTCHITAGRGNLSLKCVNTKGINIKSIQYFDNGMFVSAEKQGDIFMFPSDIVEFINYGEGNGQTLQGAVCLKIQYAVSKGKVVEETSSLTLFM